MLEAVGVIHVLAEAGAFLKHPEVAQPSSGRL